ncbi:hypothetical protein HanHA300_Chr17g0653301 [Helianthus annuus]|nr:hypothetical protein HanHA300_Chr17g0653301 [Helianthus annuus]KAJ0447408.1 hypothetical protein HanHA89_Chr17g0705061 [Helianthus annuus]
MKYNHTRHSTTTHVTGPFFIGVLEVQKGVAGSQVPSCTTEEKVLDSRSHVEPQVFRGHVRLDTDSYTLSTM